MAINPFISLFPGTAAAGAGAAGAGPFAGMSTLFGGGAGAAGAAGGLFGIPWAIAIPMLISIFGGALGGGDEDEEALQEALRLKQQMKILGIQQPQQYQSPYLPQIDETLFRALINNMKRTANWGWPEGMGMDTSWLDTILGQGLEKRPWGQQLRRL